MALARALVPLYVVSDSDTERLKNTKVLAASLQAGDLSLPEVLTECRNRNAGKSILLIADNSRRHLPSSAMKRFATGSWTF